MYKFRQSFRESTVITALLLAAAALAAPGAAAAEGASIAPVVSRLQLRDGARNPQVALGEKSLWVVYVMTDEHNAYCRRSGDGGATWTAAARINSTPGCVSSGMERSPRIAIGKDGVLHVVWEPQFPPGGGQVWYSQTTDGQQFTPQRDIRQAPRGYDEPTLTADKQGNVYAAWLDGRGGPDPESPVASPLYMAESRDNGVTWSPADRIQSDYPGNFCGCCMPRLFLGTDGSTYVAARGGYHNVRDIWLLHRLADGAWKSTRISDNNWILNACPMSGPSTAQGPDGIEVAWMSQGSVFWKRVDPGSGVPTAAVSVGTPLGEPDNARQNYPVVLVNADGVTCVAWNQGGHVLWKTFSRTMNTISSGDLGAGVGEGAAAGRVTGFVTPTGEFKVVF